jgi:hypothetical protein
MKMILLVFLMVFSLSSTGQDSERLTPIVELSFNTVFNPETPSIKHLPHTISRWDVLDGSKFTEDKRQRPLYYRLPLTLKIGFMLETNKKNSIAIALSYNHFSRTDTLGSRLRYNDQVDQNAGFVNPSYYTLTSGYHIYRTVGVDIHYFLEDAVGSFNHRLGVGLGVQRILGSSYFLNHRHYKTGENTDYSDTDLSLTDNIWIFNPAISYQANVYNLEHTSYWLTSKFAFSAQEKYERGPLGSILSFGLLVELK